MARSGIENTEKHFNTSLFSFTIYYKNVLLYISITSGFRARHWVCKPCTQWNVGISNDVSIDSNVGDNRLVFTYCL